jgi:hypothetical protein
MTPLQKCALIAVCVIVATTLRTNAAAQTPTVPVALGEPCQLSKLDGLNPTAALTKAFQSGDWALLKKHVGAIRKLFETGACKQGVTDADYFLVSWVGDTTLGDTALMTAVVHERGGEEYVSRLPGLSAGGTPKLYQLFVSREHDDVMASVYMSTREENPLLKQIPDVAEKILDPLLGLLSANMGVERREAARAETPPAGWATLSRVDLPYARAVVKVEMKAALAPTVTGLQRASTRLKNTLALIDVPYSSDAKLLANDLDTIVASKAEKCIREAPATSCLSTLDPEFRKRYDGTCDGCTEEVAKARRLVDTKYRALAAAVGAEELKGTAELRNVPFTKYTFGLMTAFSFWRTSNAPRVKVDNGVLENDPLDRQLIMVTFNSAFTPYDADAFSITGAEKHRWFIGAAITPTFGVGVGYSYLPIRRLGINIGYALLGISTAAEDKQIGEAPASTNDPFKLGVTGAAFFGLSYNFK